MNCFGKITRNLLCVLLATSLLISVSVVASAEKEPFNKAVVISKDSGQKNISGKWAGNVTDGDAVITVKSGFNGTITLSDVSIDLSQFSGACPIFIEAGASPTIVVSGSNTLVSGSGRAGIEVPAKAALTLWGDGKLDVTGGSGGAGIGGGEGMNCGTVSFNDFVNPDAGWIKVKAQGGSDAAGIGGGRAGNGGTVSIDGGEIEAIGQNGAQDIGYGAGEVKGTAGTTAIRGGLLVRYKNIGWTPTDSAERRHIKILAHYAENDQKDLPLPQDGYVKISGCDIPSVNTHKYPVAGSSEEEDIAHLYLPINNYIVTIDLEVPQFVSTTSHELITKTSRITDDTLTLVVRSQNDNNRTYISRHY